MFSSSYGYYNFDRSSVLEVSSTLAFDHVLRIVIIEKSKKRGVSPDILE